MRPMILAHIAAMAMASRGSGVGTIELDPNDPLGVGLDVKGDFDDAFASGFIPRAPKGATPSKYVPHQGKREMERRRKRLAKAQA